MVIQQEKLNELQKKNIEAAMRLAQMSIENSRQIMELQVNTAKALFEDGVKNAKAMSDTKDPQALALMYNDFAQATTEKMLGCARNIAEISSRAQSEVGKMVSEQLSSGGQDMVEALQKIFKGMPITDQNAMTAMQTALDTTRSAFEQMSRASTEAFQAFTQGGKR